MLAAAPGWQARARVVVPVGAVVAAAVVPFYVVAPVDTVRAMTAVFVAGVRLEKTPTVVGLLDMAEKTKLTVARDAPIVLAAVLVVWARWRAAHRLLAPRPLVGLALACLATRLVFEISLLNYYFLAVGVALVLLDVIGRRLPVWSVGWIVATRFVLTPLAPHVALGADRSIVPVGRAGPHRARARPGQERPDGPAVPVPARLSSAPGPSATGLPGLGRQGQALLDGVASVQRGARAVSRRLGPVFDFDHGLAR